MPRSHKLRLRRSKLALVALFTGLALLTANLVADHLGLKYLHPDNRLWYTSAYAQQQSEQQLDLVILGTSKARFGINTTRVAEALADEGHGPFEAFNLAQPAGSTVRNAAMLRDLIESNGCPSVIVLGVTRVGLHPEGIWWRLLGDYVTPRDLPVLGADLTTLEHANGYLSSATRGFERFYDYLVRPPSKKEVELEVRRRGSQYRDRPPNFPRLERDLDLAPPTSEAPPRTVNTRTFELRGAPERALQALSDSARRCSALLVMVQMPIVPVLSRGYMSHFELQLHSEMARFAAQNAAVLVDFNQIDLGLTTDQFRDWNHLNYEGAEILSDYLARQVIAPALEARRQFGSSDLSDLME